MKRLAILIAAVILAISTACNPNCQRLHNIETGIKPTTQRTADPAILAQLPDTAKSNAELDEYYDSAYVEWDANKHDYVFVQFGGEPGATEPNGDSQDTMMSWLEKHGNPDDSLDAAFMSYFDAETAFFEVYPMSKKVHMPYLRYGEIWDTPYRLVAEVKLDKLPELFMHVINGTPCGQLASESFQYLASRIGDPERPWIIEPYWYASIPKLELSSRYGFDDYLSVHPIITFTERVQSAEQYLTCLSDPALSDNTKTNLLMQYGVAGLPFIYDQVINQNNEAYLPYAHAVLPTWIVIRERDRGKSINETTDLQIIRLLLEECKEDVAGVSRVGHINYLADR